MSYVDTPLALKLATTLNTELACSEVANVSIDLRRDEHKKLSIEVTASKGLILSRLFINSGSSEDLAQFIRKNVTAYLRGQKTFQQFRQFAVQYGNGF